MPRISPHHYHVSMTHFNIVLPHMSWSSKWSLQVFRSWNTILLTLSLSTKRNKACRLECGSERGSLYVRTADFCVSNVQIFRDTPDGYTCRPAMAITQADQNRREGYSAVFKLVFFWDSFALEVKSSLLLTLCLSPDSATSRTCGAYVKMDLGRIRCNVRWMKLAEDRVR